MKKMRRCRHCGIRVPREGMRYDQLACSEECANEIWIKRQVEAGTECSECLAGACEEVEAHVLAS